MGTIEQIYRIVGGLDRSWLQSMRQGEEAARDLKRATDDAGEGLDDMSGEARGTTGIIGQLTGALGGAKGALIGIGAAVGGAVAAFTVLANSARNTLDELQELALFVPEWDLTGVSRLQRSLDVLGLSATRIDGVADALGEASIRIAEGQFDLGSGLSTMIQRALTDASLAGRTIEAIRADYDRLVATFGVAEARRRFDESFGGTGSEGLFALFALTETGEIEAAFNRTRGLTESQIEALQEARLAQTQFNQSMELFTGTVLQALAPVSRIVAGIGEFIGNSEGAQRVIQYLVIPALIGLVALLTIVTIKAATAGVAMLVAMAPALPIIAAVAGAVGLIGLAIANWPAIWGAIKRAVEPVVNLFRNIVDFIRDIVSSPLGFLIPGVGQLRVDQAAAGAVGSGIRAVTGGGYTSYSSTSTSTATTTRVTNINVNATSESDESLGRAVAYEVAAQEDTAR